jgi:hypothetical protein
MLDRMTMGATNVARGSQSQLATGSQAGYFLTTVKTTGIKKAQAL